MERVTKSPQTFSENNPKENLLMNFDSTILNHHADQTSSLNLPVLQIPLINMAGFLSGDPFLASEATRLVSEAAKRHGFFIVTNHGVDEQLLSRAYTSMDIFFESQVSEKEKAQRKWGELSGYASSFVEGSEEKLPWKESLSILFSPEEKSENHSPVVKDYFVKTMGDGYEDFGRVYQEYAEAMSNLSLNIMELLGMSLGIKRSHFKEFFEDNESIFRLNYYPNSKQPYGALGTGAHCDPTSLTILYQNQVSGLQAFVDNQWQSIIPSPKALVVNIGDTFMALTNGKYKSCLHRTVVGSEPEKKSLTFFLSPKVNKMVKPPVELEGERAYPNFTWSKLLEFTTKHYLSDMKTLGVFTNWLKNEESS